MNAEIRYDSIPAELEACGLLGGDASNPVWNEYVQQFREPYRDDLRAIRAAIERAGLVGCTAEDVANDIWFQVGTHAWSFSWRAWGDLMQAIVGKREGYMRYYM